jgi:hypothetical protein
VASKVCAVLVALVAMLACRNQHDWVVVPGVRVGPITASSSEADLRTAFGDAAVHAKDIDVGEGVTEPGTDIYGAIPGKQLAVLWADPATRKHPSRVMICYTQLQGECAWRTGDGIGMKTTLKDLERRNGRPFKLLGFGWDYSGTVSSWEGGNLEALTKRLLLRLMPDEAGTASEEYRTVLGETEYLSSNPAMQKLNPVVYAMDQVFAFRAATSGSGQPR